MNDEPTSPPHPPLRIVCVCGARPNFMKVAPLMEAFARTDRIETQLVHTGQHYDQRMSRQFFEGLGLPEPDINLGVGSAGHAVQTAEIMRRFEPVVQRWRPDWVIVVGDVNSTLACALVACKLGVKVAHVEAGLRSFDRRMPEEINRLLTDSLCDLLLVSDPAGMENLRREGIAENRTHYVGNVMIDTLRKHQARAHRSMILHELGVVKKGYAVLTLHRPANVDQAVTLGSILEAVEIIGQDMPVVFPLHPRTEKRIATFGLTDRIRSMSSLRTPQPLGYLDFLKLMADAEFVLTDSGGIQEETTVLGVACLTLRERTERPVTVTQGTNRLVSPNAEAIVKAYRNRLTHPLNGNRLPDLWDGRAAERIARILIERR